MSRKGSAASVSAKSVKGKHNETGNDPVTAEIKAAYIAVLNQTDKDISSKDELEKVLQQAGRNPSQKTIDQYWTKNTKKLSFKEVSEIIKELKPTTEDDLLTAFKKIDVNGDGYITQKELSRILTQRGDRMSEKEVDDMIAEADSDGDKKLNYKEFCQMVMSTTSRCQESSLKRLERKERKQKRALKSAASSKKNSSLASESKKKEEMGIEMSLPPVSKQQPSIKEPLNITDWYHTHTKGSFHLDDEEKILSHQYVLQVDVKTKLWLTVKPINVGVVKASTKVPKTDVNIFIVKQNDHGILGDVVCFTNVKNREKYCVQCELPPGSYRLLPMTTGCHFKPRTRTVREKTKLIQPKGDDECELTKEFKNALNSIYEMVDIDSNGTLNRNEFNMFQLRTGGESVDDDAWEVVEENFELKKGELTRKGFLDLNEMEANDGYAEGGEVDDLWVTLSSMGFADDLILDEACPFRVDIYTEHCPAVVRAQPLQRGGPTLQKIVGQSVIHAAGFTRVKTIGQVKLHTYMGDGRVTFVLENTGSKRCSMKLDCSKCENCLANHDDKIKTVQCLAGSVTIGYHLVPKDENKEWIINCQETLLTS
nr:EF-hand calcium-binding domain-containing protein 7-like [Lytechinus pictus]